MRGPVTRALDTWPAARKDLPAPDGIKDAITSRFDELPLVREVRPSMVGGHVVDGARRRMTRRVHDGLGDRLRLRRQLCLPGHQRREIVGPSRGRVGQRREWKKFRP